MGDPMTPPGLRVDRTLRVSLLVTAIFLVGIGVGIQRVGVAAPLRTTTSTSTTSTTTTTTAGHHTTTTTTPHAVLPPGVEATSPGPRHPSHCPLTLSPLTPTSASLAVSPRRCSVLEIGDSLGNDLGWGLARQLGGYPWLRMDQEDKSSSGLANSWFFNWPSHLRTDLATYHPNLVLVMLGGNDEQGYYVKGRLENFGTPAWRATYQGYIRQIVDMCRAAGAQVLWVGLPVMQPTFYSQGVAVLDSLYGATLRHVPGAAYVPTWHLFADANGAFRPSGPVNGVVQGLRAPDGIHFSSAGEDVLATYVTTLMGQLFHLPLRAAQPAILTP